MRKELLTKNNYEEEPQRRWNSAAFQPQWLCVSVLESAIWVCVFLFVCLDVGELQTEGDPKAQLLD